MSALPYPLFRVLSDLGDDNPMFVEIAGIWVTRANIDNYDGWIELVDKI